MALTFFKTPKNRKYNYKPVYYNKEKEERENRYKSSLGNKSEDYNEEELRTRIQQRWKRNTGVREKRSSNIRLIIIILALALIVYWLFFR